MAAVTFAKIKFMKVHSTNYFNSFIAVADDSPALTGEIPPIKTGAPTVATIQFEMISKQPYEYNSDEVVFEVFALKQDLTRTERPAARLAFFSKGQPCLRASPLTKRYGWGVHFNEEGKMALYGCETKMYKKLAGDKDITQLKAMRSSK
jgi:Family of unknown function (DUF6157)